MRHVRTVIIATMVTAGAAAFASCGGSSATAPINAAPPDSVQEQIAQSVAASIQSEIASFTDFGAFSFLTPFVVSPDVTVGQGVSRLRAMSRRRPRGSVSTLSFDSECPTVSPATPADADADGVPDQATLTYTTAHCTDVEAGETITLTGTWIAGDSTPNTPDLDDNEQIQNLRLTETGASAGFNLAAAGGVSIVETAGKVTADMNFWLSILETAPQAEQDSLSESGGVEFDFTPSGNPLTQDSQLPAGTLQIDLTDSFVLGGQTAYTFTIATPTALTIDPGCPSSVTSGVASVTFNAGTKAVETITWTGCGVYTVAKA